MTKFVSSVRRRISRVPYVLPAAFVVWRVLREWRPSLVASNRRARRQSAIPIPPNSLIFSATGTRDVTWFLRAGKLSADSFKSALSDINRPIETFRNVLEFGCGCGRVLRQWVGVKGPKFCGTDYNPAGPNWGRQNLPTIEFAVNELEPPLPFATGTFDLVYAVSVFTHFPTALQRPWIEEMHRVLEADGILMLTLSGEGDSDRMTEAERKRFAAGELVEVDPRYAGTNMCSAYHPEAFVRKNWTDLFRILKVYREGALGSPRQDLYVFQRLA